MKLYRFILAFVLIVGVALAFFSCSKSAPTTRTKTTAGDTTREKPKKADPKKQVKCSELGSGKCDKNCKEICDDIFSGDAEKDCEKLSESLVKDFRKIIKDTGDGDIKDLKKLNLPALNCLLDLDDQEFVSAIKDMSSRQAKKFLAHISDKEDIAEILYEEDDEFNILKQLFKEAANSSNFEEFLRVDIEDSKPFFWLSAEEKNEPAFEWFESYVSDHCEDSPSDCPGYDDIDELGAYCKVFLDGTTYTKDKNKKWKEFISDADLFEDRYESVVESADYEYTVSSGSKDFVDYIWKEELKGDFKDFCRLEVEITDEERKLRSRETQRKYFSEAACKENMKPAGGNADGAGDEDTTTDADVTRIWNWADCSGGPPNCAFARDDNSNKWKWGNIYGTGPDRRANRFNSNRLKGIGQTFWFLNKDKEIIDGESIIENGDLDDSEFHSEFKIFMRRRNIEAQGNVDDPKESKVRRASFMYYNLVEENDTKYENCDTIEARDTGDEEKCLYHYCLVDYELNNDNTVKTCDVLKCALGRPTSITP